MRKKTNTNKKLVKSAKNYSKSSKFYLSRIKNSLKNQLLTEFFSDSKENLERSLSLYELELVKWTVIIYHQANLTNKVNKKTLKLLNNFINPGGWLCTSNYSFKITDYEERIKFIEDHNIIDNITDLKLYCKKYSKYVYTYLRIKVEFESLLEQREKLFPAFINC